MTSLYLPPLSTPMYCVSSSDIENTLSAPFSFSVGIYWQYMDAASGSSAINHWLSLIPAYIYKRTTVSIGITRFSFVLYVG